MDKVLGNRVVLVTGSSGFIGRLLVAHLQRLHWTVIETSRPSKIAKPGSKTYVCSKEVIPYEIGDFTFSPELWDRVDAVVHLAHEFAPGSEENNYLGSVKLFDYSISRGVKKNVFVSSYSARKDAVTEYGRVKYRIERALKGKVSIIRPGLVVGDSGLFGRIAGFVRKSPIVPQIGFANREMPVVDADDLCTVISRVIEMDCCVECNLFQPSFISYRALVSTLAGVMNKRVICLPIPQLAVLIGIRILDKAGIKVPVNTDNVKAFMHNQSDRIENHWHQYLGQEQTLSGMCNKHFAPK